MVMMIVEKEGVPFSVAWSWVIETLADTEQVNTPHLDDLVEKVPNGYNSLSNNSKERLAFRHLEDISHTPILSDDDTSSSPASSLHRLCADVLVPAQDVYCRLLVEEIDASSARAVHDFVLRKRVQLPKCSLQELEDLLTNGSNPIAASLRKASGLTIEQGEDCSREPDQTQTPEPDSTYLAPENLDNRMQDDCRVESPISTAKVVMEMQTDFTRFVAENLDNIVQDDCGPKSPNSATNIDMDMQVDSTRFVSEILDNLVQDVCSAKSPDSTTKINVEAQDDSTPLVSENLTNLGQDDCGAKSSNSSTTANVEKHAVDVNHLVSDNLHNLMQDNTGAKSPISTTKMDMEIVQADSTRLVSKNIDNLVQNDAGAIFPISGTNMDMEIVQADSTRLVSKNLDNLLQDDAGAKSPISTTKIDREMVQVDSTRLVSENFDNLVQENCRAKFPYSVTKVDVEKQSDSTHLVSINLDNLVQDCIAKSPNSTTKMDTKIVQADSTHLVPENTETLVPANCSAKSPESSTKIYMEMESFDKDPIEIDLSEYDYCVKCKKRGELLVCSGSACRISVHKSCLDCEPSCDGMGNFHCPICLNLQASIVLQQKRKSSSGQGKRLCWQRLNWTNITPAKLKMKPEQKQEPVTLRVEL